jgi:hypothetical protein
VSDDKILDRARKLKRMMDGGAFDNEIEQARILLMRLLDKHGLTLDSLDETKRTYRKFSYVNRWEKSLLIQVIGMVRDEHEFTSRSIGRAYFIELTDAEYADVSVLYKLYRKELMAEFDALTDAFFQRNGLFPATPSGKPAQHTVMDEEFLERLRIHYKNLRTLPDPRHKQLPTGELVA